MRDTSGSQGFAFSAYAPTQFQDDVDFAECALDEQLEQLQRHYATASRAVARARFEIELLEKRDDIPEHLLPNARRQRKPAARACSPLSKLSRTDWRISNETAD